MKILLKKYPMGSLPNQKTAGKYIDEYLYDNLKVLAEAIVKDNTFLGIVSSSTLEVGTGKSCFCQQLGEAWTEMVNEMHNQTLTFDIKNIVFRPKELIKRAFEVPKYSCIILDEWEETNYWSELGMTLRSFFRKCRQLNLFILVICPNFFQVPMSYAISRSIFFIDVRFETNFERGFFSLYNFKKKKVLYLVGKKSQDYSCVKPDFFGRFSDGYAVPREIYLEAKLKDAKDYENDSKKPVTEAQLKAKLFKQIHINLPKISVKDLALGFGVSCNTAFRYLKEDFSEENGGVEV
jgi:hypothetical protein